MCTTRPTSVWARESPDPCQFHHVFKLDILPSSWISRIMTTLVCSGPCMSVVSQCYGYPRSERLEAMMEAMRERLAGKVGNANNNAFKLRKLFKMYDSTGCGRVRSIDVQNFVMSEMSLQVHRRAVLRR